jgi:hypothetical protein
MAQRLEGDLAKPSYHLCIWTLFLTVPAGASEDSSLLAKWDFEEGGLKGWAATAPENDLVVALDNDASHSGAACIRMERLVDGDGYAYAGIEIPQGSGFNNLRMRLFVRTKDLAEGDAVVKILILREGNVIDMIPMNKSGKTPFIALPASGEWTQVEGSGAIPNNIDSLTVIVGTTGKGVVWLDDISVEGLVDAGGNGK